LILDINAIGFLHESYFTPLSSDDSNDDEVVKVTNLLFKNVRIDYDKVPVQFFYYHNVKEQLATLNKIFHIILILPEIKEVYLKTLLSIQTLFDGVYLIEKKPSKEMNWGDNIY
jgi:ABC-type long-subunit fatty acid transport system fused permease/ATPase subunit